ncbi:hypothetical protein [Clostridium sp. JNZ J1-5]|nr:hypothetical protein [Clostridium sp.]
MSRCTFLSTHSNKVICFRECPFYDCQENEGICPFESVTKDKMLNSSMFYEYDLIENDSITLLEELYENNKYLKILQA